MNFAILLTRDMPKSPGQVPKLLFVCTFLMYGIGQVSGIIHYCCINECPVLTFCVPPYKGTKCLLQETAYSTVPLSAVWCLITQTFCRFRFTLTCSDFVKPVPTFHQTWGKTASERLCFITVYYKTILSPSFLAWSCSIKDNPIFCLTTHF